VVEPARGAEGSVVSQHVGPGWHGAGRSDTRGTHLSPPPVQGTCIFILHRRYDAAHRPLVASLWCWWLRPRPAAPDSPARNIAASIPTTASSVHPSPTTLLLSLSLPISCFTLHSTVPSSTSHMEAPPIKRVPMTSFARRTVEHRISHPHTAPRGGSRAAWLPPSFFLFTPMCAGRHAHLGAVRQHRIYSFYSTPGRLENCDSRRCNLYHVHIRPPCRAYLGACTAI